MNDVTQSQSFTDFFIHRPVFSWVLNLIMILLGITAFFALPVRQYPVTEGTSVTIITSFDGASSIIESQITKVLEDSLVSVQGLESMTSSSSRGESRVDLNFQNRSIDGAVADVRDLVSKLKLPNGVVPEIYKSNPNASSVMELVLTSKTLPLDQLFDVANRNLKSSLESVSGVGLVEIFGGSKLQVSIIIDPFKMQSFKISAIELSQALKRHNLQRSAGRIREKDREFSLTTQATLKNLKEFQDIILTRSGEKYNNVARLSDIATITIEPHEEVGKVYYNGKPGVSIMVRPQSTGSPVNISKEIRKRLESFKEELPESVSLEIFYDKAEYVTHSIYNVYKTLIEAVVLVLLVILFFLKSFRASLVPIITIPISLIATLFVMQLLGFSLNILSLLAIVLAIGLVVDDAVVVLENIYRHMEEGKKRFQATIEGTREIRFSIIAMTLTLAAVYAPIAITPGMIGKVFKEFALTLAAAVLISGVVSLTLSPVMCSRLLVQHGHNRETTISLWIDSFLGKLESLYIRWLDRSLGHSILSLFIAGSFTVSAILVGWYGLKKELSPPMDEGGINMTVFPPPSNNLNYLTARVPELDAMLKNNENIQNRLITLNRMDYSFIKCILKPWEQRKNSCVDIVESLKDPMNSVRGIKTYIRPLTSSIISSGTKAQFPFSFNILTNRSAEDLMKTGRRLKSFLGKYPGIAEVDYSETVPEVEYDLTLHRERASQLGVDPEEVATMLNILVQGQEVGHFEKDGLLYPVYIMSNENTKRSKEDIATIPVRGSHQSKITQVHLGSIMEFTAKNSDAVIEHSMKKRSYSINAKLKEGYSLADVYLSFKRDSSQVLSRDYVLEPTGELGGYFKEQSTIYIIFGLALLFIFLVMAAQFESFKAPLVILLSVPMALGGAIFSLLWLKNGSINIYSQIGLITLVGLITKHGILLVDFANQQMRIGLSALDAIRKACFLRLRPILMTTLAMVLGAVPLALSSGAGAEARQQIGTVIVGGMSIGTLFTLFVVPIFYVLFFKRSTFMAVEESRNIKRKAFKGP